ncbi:MAG: sensor domain-containing diguanylate cyclase [Acidovorax sp.]|jgi:diguanylate cyclase|nr:sensor domain-containing diguanylate cyclase [Acidovorax sp.]
METLLPRLSDVLVQARSLEALTRPLLAMLQQVTRLESAYLTRIDLPQAQQQVLYVCNTGELRMPEGLSVPWEDTLCRRALESGQSYTGNVADCWGDSEAARTLGLRTYLSTPVRMPQGQLYGTLCAASTTEQAVQADAMEMLQLFAGLIGQQVERELLLQELQQRNQELATHALHDALTGLPNRRALLEELPRMWARALRNERCLLLAFIDLDGFKSINDSHGHEVGDQLLCTLSRQLRTALRGSDFAARFGGDEFVVLGTGPEHGEAPSPREATGELQQRLQWATQCEIALPSSLLHYPGASVGVVFIDPARTTPEQALEQADAAMYQVKRTRRTAALH